MENDDMLPNEVRFASGSSILRWPSCVQHCAAVALLGYWRRPHGTGDGARNARSFSHSPFLGRGAGPRAVGHVAALRRRRAFRRIVCACERRQRKRSAVSGPRRTRSFRCPTSTVSGRPLERRRCVHSGSTGVHAMTARPAPEPTRARFANPQSKPFAKMASSCWHRGGTLPRCHSPAPWRTT